MLLPIQTTNRYLKLCAPAWPPSAIQLLSLKEQILRFDRMIKAWHRSNQASKRLNCIPGVGPLLATALVASVADHLPVGSKFLGLDRNSCQSSVRAAERTGSVASANRVTAICVAYSSPAHPPSFATLLAKRIEQDFAGVMIAVHPHFEFGTGDENSPLHGKASIMEFRKWPYAGWCQSAGWLRASARKTAKICPLVVP